MAKAEQRIIRCPGCGKTTEIKIKENDYTKHYFQCKKCTTKFELIFNRPDRQELQEIFMNDEIPSSLSGLPTRVFGPVRSLFNFRLPRLLKSSRQERKPIIFKGKKNGR